MHQNPKLPAVRIKNPFNVEKKIEINVSRLFEFGIIHIKFQANVYNIIRFKPKKNDVQN